LRERYRSGEVIGTPDTVGEPEADVSTSPEPSPFEQRLRELVESHLTDGGLDHNLLADLAGLSYHQLYRGLKETTGESPSRFIRRVRVERAAELLRARAGSVSEVAYSVGFESLSYFSRAFTERFNVPPSAVLRGELTGPASEH
jgi:AraC-like DNA-binding protein